MNETTELKKGILKEKTLVRKSDGTPDVFNDYYKHQLLFDNGDFGTSFSKEQNIPQEIGKEYQYKLKKGENNRGVYYTISFNLESGKYSGGWKGGNSQINIKAKLLEIAASFADKPELITNIEKNLKGLELLLGTGEQNQTGTNDTRTEPDETILKHISTMFENYRKAIIPSEELKYKQEIVKLLSLYRISEENINKL